MHDLTGQGAIIKSTEEFFRSGSELGLRRRRMTIKNLEERLRRTLLARIRAGQMTGADLAEAAGFDQGSMSNFLRGKRRLSLESMERLLRVQKLSLLDLLEPAEARLCAKLHPALRDGYEGVPLVESAVVANEPVVGCDQIKAVLKFKKAFLRRLRPKLHDLERQEWRRFVLMKVDAREAMSMYPRLLPGATLLIDRHYTSLVPYRRQERNLYAIRNDSRCTIKYVEEAESALVLRPHNQHYPIDTVAIALGKGPEDYIAGRVCHIAIEA
jgi:transcriptional regulator with XRE-family HTH domain